MASAVGRRVTQLGYDRARLLLLLTGFGVLVVVVAVTYARRVETVEVIATLLFIPVFLGIAFDRVRGGLIMAVVASAVYVALRYPAIDAIGVGEFTGLIASRSVAYFLFGAIGGWADRTLEESLHKLELIDYIDDATGLHNAWYFLDETAVELARVGRYNTIFSVVDYKFPVSTFAKLPRRELDSMLKDLGRSLKSDVRIVDHVTFASDASTHHLTALLPHVDGAAAEQFRLRFRDRVLESLTPHGVAPAEEEGSWTMLTVPGDEAGLERLRERFVHLDEFEHGHVHDEVLAARGQADGPEDRTP